MPLARPVPRNAPRLLAGGGRGNDHFGFVTQFQDTCRMMLLQAQKSGKRARSVGSKAAQLLPPQPLLSGSRVHAVAPVHRQSFSSSRSHPTLHSLIQLLFKPGGRQLAADGGLQSLLQIGDLHSDRQFPKQARSANTNGAGPFVNQAHCCRSAVVYMKDMTEEEFLNHNKERRVTASGLAPPSGVAAGMYIRCVHTNLARPGC